MPQVAQLRTHSGVFWQVKVQVQGQFQGKHGYEHYSSIVVEMLNRWREVIGIAIVDCGRNNVGIVLKRGREREMSLFGSGQSVPSANNLPCDCRGTSGPRKTETLEC
jgi:hypothetical protein